MSRAAVLTLILACLGAAGVFTLPAYAHDIIAWGDQTFDSSDFPITNAVAISAGASHSLTLKSDGSIVGWGYNGDGQATPPAGSDFVAIAAGGGHCLALRRVCDFVLPGDMNDDCRVDFSDFAVMAENWLIDCTANPSSPACVPK